MLDKSSHNPDVLSCLANLSSDEVFTPPQMANQMLDLLPKEIWSDKNARFLDPVCKSGVFLREIAKRLDTGLEKTIPELQSRLDHIFSNNKSEAVKKAKKEANDQELSDKDKKNLSEEEKQYKTLRRQIQEKLVKFSFSPRRIDF